MNIKSGTGTLYLIPTQLSDPADAAQVLPPLVVEQALKLNHYIAENAKSARAFLKALGISRPLSGVQIVELNKHLGSADRSLGLASMDLLLAPLKDGIDVGLVSEAGAPAVADPGALVVAAAHRAGIRVRPLVGPSSILLALMGSGLNGQQFAFQGYLPVDRPARIKAIQRLEAASTSSGGTTQIFIETPYRHAALMGDLLSTLVESTHLCIAQNLTGKDESINTLTVKDWRALASADDGKRPTIYLILAARSSV